ncbi:hypothetical protein [Hyphomicrobium sp. 99]|uniref:hypothetical protein n=1 Tax=Hyphomicrobium sp. 99 TaxID=1163419 RepID=UPI001FD8A452|nr:hypothetical protein [Hyphomicrobium sp. 99]
MRRPPRRRDEPLFSKALMIWSLFPGLMVFGVLASVLSWPGTAACRKPIRQPFEVIDVRQ